MRPRQKMGSKNTPLGPGERFQRVVSLTFVDHDLRNHRDDTQHSRVITEDARRVPNPLSPLQSRIRHLGSILSLHHTTLT